MLSSTTSLVSITSQLWIILKTNDAERSGIMATDNIVAEIEEEPEPGIFYRTGHYELLLGKEVNPSCDPGGPAVGSLVLNLTGSQKPPRRQGAGGGRASEC